MLRSAVVFLALCGSAAVTMAARSQKFLTGHITCVEPNGHIHKVVQSSEDNSSYIYSDYGKPVLFETEARFSANGSANIWQLQDKSLFFSVMDSMEYFDPQRVKLLLSRARVFHVIRASKTEIDNPATYPGIRKMPQQLKIQSPVWRLDSARKLYAEWLEKNGNQVLLHPIWKGNSARIILVDNVEAYHRVYPDTPSCQLQFNIVP